MWPGNEATSHTSVTKENPTQVTRLSLLGWGGHLDMRLPKMACTLVGIDYQDTLNLIENTHWQLSTVYVNDHL